MRDKKKGGQNDDSIYEATFQKCKSQKCSENQSRYVIHIQ